VQGVLDLIEGATSAVKDEFIVFKNKTKMHRWPFFKRKFFILHTKAIF
jgi:hypothetical protein